MGLRPGPKKGSSGRPNKKRDTIDPIEQQRLAVLAALQEE
jgi:hypothetical protein